MTLRALPAVECVALRLLRFLWTFVAFEHEENKSLKDVAYNECLAGTRENEGNSNISLSLKGG